MPAQSRSGKATDQRVDLVERRQQVTDHHRLAVARQRLEARKSRWLARSSQRQREPAQYRAAGRWWQAGPEQRDTLAAADEQRRKREQQQIGAIALRRQLRSRGIVHRGRGVAPQPYALGSLPFRLADVEPHRFRALAPVDARYRIARLVLAELPERLASADAPPAVHALRHGGRDTLGLDQQRRQRRRELFGAVLERRFRHQRNGAIRRSMMAAMVTPSARATKLSAMRWRSTGRASATTSSTDGASLPSSSARARQASISAWLARGPGPQAMCWRASAISLSSGRPERTSARIASTTLSPTGTRRTRRCAASSSPAESAAPTCSSATPVVATSICRSEARSG